MPPKKKIKKLGPFDYLNSINMSKTDIMVDQEAEKGYVPFIINRGLSYFLDTVMLANEINLNPHLTKKMQYAFLQGAVRRRKRFSKWHKTTESDPITTIKEYYGYSTRAAREVAGLLSEADIEKMETHLDRGGRI